MLLNNDFDLSMPIKIFALNTNVLHLIPKANKLKSKQLPVKQQNKRLKYSTFEIFRTAMLHTIAKHISKYAVP